MKKLSQVLSTLENWVLLFLFLLMVLVAVLQIILRHSPVGGLFWADDFLRVEVLWLAMTGAVVASRDRHHLGLDLARRFLPEASRHLVERLVSLLTCMVAAVLAWYCGRYVAVERESNTLAFANVPGWWAELALPVGFALVAVHYFFHLWGRSASGDRQ